MWSKLGVEQNIPFPISCINSRSGNSSLCRVQRPIETSLRPEVAKCTNSLHLRFLHTLHLGTLGCLVERCKWNCNIELLGSYLKTEQHPKSAESRLSQCQMGPTMGYERIAVA